MQRSIHGLVLGLAALAAGSCVGAAPAAKTVGTKTVNVIVLNYDPILKTQSNMRLHEYMHWSDPYKLTLSLVDDLRKASNGYVDYRIVETIEFNGFPTKRNGFTYDEKSFLAVMKNPDTAVHGTTGFAKMFEQFDLAKKIKEKNVGEIWLWGSPWFDWDELHYKIPGDKIPYQTDNPWFYRPYDIPDVGKTIWIMGFSYERGEGEALEDFCHRIESVMSITVGKGVWDQKKNPDNIWNKFTRIDRDFPGESEVGGTHEAPNSAGGYDWSNTKEVWTYADDWLTYPKLPRQKKLLNAKTGGWEGIVNHHMWFMNHLPHNPGVTDGFYNNWWQYVVNYDEAVKNLPPPGATFEKAKSAIYSTD